MYYLAKCLEDSHENLFRGPVRELTVLLTEPAARKSLQVDGIRPLSRHSLVHVLGVTEEGVPVVTRREIHLILYCTNLRTGRERRVAVNSAEGHNSTASQTAASKLTKDVTKTEMLQPAT